MMTSKTSAARLATFSVAAILVSLATFSARGQDRAGALFDRYFAARTSADASAAADAIVAAAVPFDEAWDRLEQGRTYAADVPKGIVSGTRQTAQGEFPYTLEVPQTYDPSKRYQVRIQLHGGIMRPEPAVRGTGGIGALAGAEQIYVLPISWRDAPWWGEDQLANVRGILDTVKRTYNVDENRVVVAGVSDGGTGAFYVAMRDTTPYAAFLPLNGFIMILGQPSVGIRDPLFPNNLRNKPFFIINGGQDQLYPTSLVGPYVQHMANGGVDVTYRPQPDGQHNTAWWPEMRDEFEAFVTAHPREPHPVQVTWQAPPVPASPSASEAPIVNRAHWILVDDVAAPRAEQPLSDLNERSMGSEPNFGIRATGMRITDVLAGSNAAAIGLLPDDIVRSINGRVLPRACRSSTCCRSRRTARR
jgi:acetyl esterase/lipase